MRALGSRGIESLFADEAVTIFVVVLTVGGVGRLLVVTVVVVGEGFGP